MNLKTILFLAVTLTFLFGAQAYQLDQIGILRTEDGKKATFSFYEASGLNEKLNQVMPDVCERNFYGYRLPTVREQAQWSQLQGAKGILEVSQVDPNNVPHNFFLKSAMNTNGQKDEFYFNSDGYTRPGNGLANDWYWSSSINSYVYPEGAYFEDAYFIDGEHGIVSRFPRWYSGGAVRCIRTP